MADFHSNIQSPSPQLPSPRFEFSIPQRAALQLLDYAFQYVSGMQDIYAAQILWQCRELVLVAAERMVA